MRKHSTVINGGQKGRGDRGVPESGFKLLKNAKSTANNWRYDAGLLNLRWLMMQVGANAVRGIRH